MIREPAVSGTFYQDVREKLIKNIEKLSGKPKSGKLSCVISPHAGYVYSGKTSSKAINSLRKAKTFIILGPNHNSLGKIFSLYPAGKWKTPLGEIKINEEISEKILDCDFVDMDEISHLYEHSIEVQIPIIQYNFKDFSLVPISITNDGYSDKFLDECKKLGKHIAEIISDKKINVIASSDFSHYLPSKTAREKDMIAIEKIESLDTRGLFDVLEKTNASVCGFGPIAVIMEIAKELGMKSVKILDHSDSGDVTGDKSSVVSYYAIGFE